MRLDHLLSKEKRELKKFSKESPVQIQASLEEALFGFEGAAKHLGKQKSDPETGV